MTVRTGMYGVTLATGFNEEGEAIEVIEYIPANFNFDLPGTEKAIYQGEIWALAHVDTSVAYTEYSLVDISGQGKEEAPAEEAPAEEAPTEEAPVQ